MKNEELRCRCATIEILEFAFRVSLISNDRADCSAVGKLLLLGSFGSLRAVLGTSLHTTVDALGIQSAADDVVTDTRQVLDTTAANHHDRVLLQVVADTGDVSSDLVTIGQTDTRDLTQSGVGLLGSRGTDCGADASLLRGAQIRLFVLQGVHTLLHSGRSGLVGDLLSALSDELVKSWHCVPPFFHDQIQRKPDFSGFFPFVRENGRTLGAACHELLNISIITKLSQENL